MITKKEILNLVSHIIRRNKGVPDRRLMHPEREWFVGLGVALLIGLGGSLYAGSFFFSQEQVIKETFTVSSDTIRYKKDVVDEVFGTYRARSLEFDALREQDGILPEVEVQVVQPKEEDSTGDSGTLRAE